MNRGMRDGGGRSRMGGGDYGGMRDYGSQGGGGGGYGSQGVLGTSPPGLLGAGLSGSGGLRMGGGGGGGGGYEMDSLLQHRALQQQLTLRESQLALANSLLQQQQQSQFLEGPGVGLRGVPGGLRMGGLSGMGGGGGGGIMMNKRRQDLRHDDFQPDFKRPRGDFRSQPRDRYRGRDSDAGNRGNSRRNQSSSSSRPNRSSDRDISGKVKKDSKEEYDPEKPTADDEEKIDGDQKYHCHVCNTSCRDDEGFRRHMNSNRHKDRMLGVLSIHEEKSVQIASRMKAEKHLRHLEDEDKKARGFCKVCDIVLTNMRYPEHQRMTFHRKRVMQVTKGCGWCNVSSFKNFTEVLAHRETEEHKKNQEAHEKREARVSSSRDRRDTERRDDKKDSKPAVKKREPIRVEMPASLAKFDPEVAVGQTCVIPVTGFFCKLCNKFYNNETAAKDTHCKTEPHFAKYKRFVYAKLKAKAEAEREAKEKAEAEEAKKKEEAEAAAKEEKAENGQSEATNKDNNQEPSTAENAEGAEGAEEEKDVEIENGEEEGGGVEEEEEEEDENAMLSADGTGMDFMEDDDDAEMEEDSLLNDTAENSAYQTADSTVDAEIAGEIGEGGDQSVEESGLSLMTGGSASQLLESSQDDSLAAEDTRDEEDAPENENDTEESGQKRATRANVSPRSSSTPTRGRGRGAATNKARRGRKMAK